MSDKEALFLYRLQQAVETLTDSERMFADKYSPRSVVNRAYYVVFYSLLSLYIKTDLNIKTSKHAGIISIFDREFIHKGIFDKKYSKIAHYLYEFRQEFDYKEFVELSYDIAGDCVAKAREFYNEIHNYIK